MILFLEHCLTGDNILKMHVGRLGSIATGMQILSAKPPLVAITIRVIFCQPNAIIPR